MDETGAVLQELIGRWRGTVSSWLRPEAAPLTGEISGSFSSLLDGGSVLYEYTSTIGEHRSDGIAIIGKDVSDGLIRMAWVDTFHTNSDVMVLTQDAKGDVLSFIGSYTAGEETWGWRVGFGPVRNNELLLIEHFNILPGGQEARAVEIKYQREDSTPGF